ncbi:lytic transglycosylase domain-containing protein [Hydrogenimonas cancrithermarum]|uniref:Lytic transglycosylase n=1 Tax=Hydrogenimonas cancrithermarum TaxID=2993563 RepID=A0ABN6WZZ5_9BACT|nr:lytic transglycosylase domain-containing protein [Hydrogenimonas cancrithermarum]BDY13912.1 lytic transglycosylase [Hydrogenimonas cancrithermarum]
MKKFLLVFVTAFGFLHASLFMEPQYNDDVKVLQTLDIESSFLRDPIFLQLKNSLTTSKRNHYLKMLERGSLYIPTLRKMIHDNNIPQVFLYMAMAESNFDTHALSHAKASGLWQFMPKTAKIYGLKIDRYIDERRDPVRSTEAAIAYLKRLHRLFGKWYLAALAYNSGEGRVLRAIKRAGSDDLHVLLDEKKKYLPRESRNYIRKIVSLALVANDAEMCFSGEQSHMFNRTEGRSLVRVKVSGGETLEHIASQIGMSGNDLKLLNPQFNYSFTPPDEGAHINIPYSRLTRFKEVYRPGRQKNMFLVHTVKKGESLSKIAHRYGISYKMILSFNRMKRPVIYPKQELIIPVPKGSLHHYRVKKGDSIYKIARRFGIKVATLKARNDLKGNIIHIGDKLVIPN